MKKMLVLLLILFTKVLADSDEDKYVDLLPDEEKQQFLDNVARRILKEVESKENVTGVQSGEVPDDQLKQHAKYVQSILKEEQGSIKKDKSDENDSNSKSVSEENENLGVQPLDTAKKAVELVTENAPIIKRSIEDGKASKTVQNRQSSEIPVIVLQNNDTSEETNEIKTVNGKNTVSNNASVTEVSLKKDPKGAESTTAGNEVKKSVSKILSNQNEEGRNVSVKALHESRRTNNEEGKLAENTTDIGTTASTVQVVNTTQKVPVEYTNVSSSEGEFTTLTYPFESSSLKDNTTENATLNGILLESTTKLTTKKDNNSESLSKSKNDTVKDSENEVVTKSTISTSTSINEETTEFVKETTTEKTKPVSEKTNPVSEKTNPVTEISKPVTEKTKPVTEKTNPVTEITKPVTETTKPVKEATEPVTKTTMPVLATTISVLETTEVFPGMTTESEMMTTDIPKGPVTDLVTANVIPVATTEKMNILVEDFTSAPSPATTVKTTTVEPITTTERKKITVFNKNNILTDKLTTAAMDSDEESIETTTKRILKHKVYVHRPVKVIVGPKAKKMAEAKANGEQNNNFIDLEKYYFENNYKVKVGNEYHVYEIPAGQSPFTKEEAPVANQPYYIPVYNYAPSNAYFNPQNRLGPNAVDPNADNMFNDDYSNNVDKTETLHVKMEYDTIYDNKRKKFGGKRKVNHNIIKRPTQTKAQKGDGKVHPEDYLDSDYYFGRVRKAIARTANFNKFPNSDEASHPAHSIREGSLKDHVRAVRNILFQQKSFGLLEKDKYGASVEAALRKGRSLDAARQSLRLNKDKDSKQIIIDQKKNFYNSEENQNTNDVDMSNEMPINEHIQKVGYLKEENETQELYVMDNFFKANVKKFIEKQAMTATPHTYVEDKSYEPNIFLGHDERMRKAGKGVNNNDNNDFSDFQETMNGQPDEDVVPVYEDNAKENIKLNLRRNEVGRVSVYLQVLKDMVTLDNKALVQYDWLGTTVDIQAALQKLFELTALVANKEDVHPADIEILRYVLFLHKLATEIIEANYLGSHLRRRLAVPKKKKMKTRFSKDKGLINRVWLYLRKDVPEVNESGALKQLNSFFIGVEDGLYDLHDAIKNVAKITKYKNQHWYQNLKDLYIDNDEKHILELLLHVTALRLFSLIEDSANNGLEIDYLQYMKQNRVHCKRTLEEMIFIIEILEEYNKYVD